MSWGVHAQSVQAFCRIQICPSCWPVFARFILRLVAMWLRLLVAACPALTHTAPCVHMSVCWHGAIVFVLVSQVLPAHFARLPKYVEFLEGAVRDKRWRDRYVPVKATGSGNSKSFALSPGFYAQVCSPTDIHDVLGFRAQGSETPQNPDLWLDVGPTSSIHQEGRQQGVHSASKTQQNSHLNSCQAEFSSKPGRTRSCVITCCAPWRYCY